jgi:hypothetical protein
MIMTAKTSTSDVQNISGVSVAFDPTLADAQKWFFTSTTTCWVKQTDAATAASQADGSVLVHPGMYLALFGNEGTKVTAIKATGAMDGVACIFQAKER